MRDKAIRRPAYRVVYAHALTVAHMSGRLVADDHPSWARITDAIKAARAGESGALDQIERELARLAGNQIGNRVGERVTPAPQAASAERKAE